MQIYKGTTRIVIPILWLGIVIKIARVRPKLFWNTFKQDLAWSKDTQKMFAHMLRHERAFHVYSNATIAGFLSNLSEWYFTIRYGSTFIAPTLFSCGFLSVMKQVELVDMKMFQNNARTRFLEIVPADELVKDSHHWGSSHNFGLLRGRLVMCDYGSKKTQSILRKYNRQIDAKDLAKLLTPRR